MVDTRTLKRVTGLAVAAGLAFAAAPAQAEAQDASLIQTVEQNLPHTPSLPPELSPNFHPPALPGWVTVPISPHIPTIDGNP
jgi:hypothetical protein